MKRFHVHVAVENLDSSIAFYSRLFGAEPSVREPNYAKWMLDDPRVNFAISKRPGTMPGVNHLGVQAESANELNDLRRQLGAADAHSLVDEPNAQCCYSVSNKHWVTDPQGIAWEAFHSLGSIEFYDGAKSAESSGCCAQMAPRQARESTHACCEDAAAERQS
jgi:catechol 2,3-dioxygenase-like lactoylglutathione lyase family enzyme